MGRESPSQDMRSLEFVIMNVGAEGGRARARVRDRPSDRLLCFLLGYSELALEVLWIDGSDDSTPIGMSSSSVFLNTAAEITQW